MKNLFFASLVIMLLSIRFSVSADLSHETWAGTVEYIESGSSGTTDPCSIFSGKTILCLRLTSDGTVRYFWMNDDDRPLIAILIAAQTSGKPILLEYISELLPGNKVCILGGEGFQYKLIRARLKN
jgi:hypothetical protein